MTATNLSSRHWKHCSTCADSSKWGTVRENYLRSDERLYSLSWWQNTLHFATLKPALKSSPLSATYGLLKAQQGEGVGLGWLCGAAGTPSLFTHQFQAKPCRCTRRVAWSRCGISSSLSVLVKTGSHLSDTTSAIDTFRSSGNKLAQAVWQFVI